MDSQYPEPSAPSFFDQTRTTLLKRLPYWTAHFLSACFHGLFLLFRELGRVIREAVGH